MEMISSSRYPNITNNRTAACGIFAKRAFKKDDALTVLAGLAATCPPEKKELWDDHFSLLEHGDETKVLLGPISFINHSCQPNVRFHICASGTTAFVIAEK